MKNQLADLDHEPDDPCFLLELPGELRNEIFRLALFHPDGVAIDCTSQKLLIQHPLALTMTCKQIRDECENLVFAQNALRLEFLPPPTDFDHLAKIIEFYYATTPWKYGLLSRFQGVHIVTEARVPRSPPPYLTFPASESLLDAIGEKAASLRWLLNADFHGVKEAFVIPMDDEGSALASVDRSLARFKVPMPTGVSQFVWELKFSIKGCFNVKEHTAAVKARSNATSGNSEDKL